MADQEEQVNWLCIIDGIKKPRLLHKLRCLDDLGRVRIAREVEKNAKCHNTQTWKRKVKHGFFSSGDVNFLTMLSCKITKLGADVLEFSSGRIDDLNIASNVFIAIDLCKLIKGQVAYVCNIKLVISCRRSIDCMKMSLLAYQLSKGHS